MILSPVLKQQFLDANGNPLAGGKLYSYLASTTTPQATYSNFSGSANTNPVILDSSGRADVWLDPTVAYKFVLKDSLDVVQWTEDNIYYSTDFSAWNSTLSYAQGAVVQDASGYGLLYVSLQNSNLNHALTDVAYWRSYDGNVRTLTANTTLAVTDNLVRSNSTAGALTMTLPPIASTPIGKRIAIKDVGTGGFTTSVKGSGAELVDGSNTWSIALVQYDSVTVMNNGTSWDVI